MLTEKYGEVTSEYSHLLSKLKQLCQPDLYSLFESKENLLEISKYKIYAIQIVAKWFQLGTDLKRVVCMMAFAECMFDIWIGDDRRRSRAKWFVDCISTYFKSRGVDCWINENGGWVELIENATRMCNK